MTTATYSSRRRFGNLLGSLLRRNLATGLYFFGATFFFFSLQYILESFSSHTFPQAALGNSTFTPYSNLATAANIYTGFSLVMMCFLLVVAPVVIGVSQMSWLHSRRAVDLYHSLPVTRAQLMGACGLSAWLTIALPLVLNYLVILVAGLIRLPMGGAFSLSLPAMLLDLLGWLITEFAILSVIMAVSTQVGSPFENLVFSCELLVAPAAVVLLNCGLSESMLTGYVNGVDLRGVAYSTPVSMMIGRYTVDASIPRQVLVGNLILTVWLAAGALIFFGALVLYRRRKSELAETSGAQGLLSGVGKVLAVYLGGLVLGLIFAGVNSGGDLSFVVGTAMGSVLVFLLVEAVLNRGFKGMKKALPFGAALVAAVTLVSVVFVTGGLGFEHRVPRGEDVKSVTINYRGRYDDCQLLNASNYTTNDREGRRRYHYRTVDQVTLTSQETIALVRSLHEEFIRTNVDGGNRSSYSDFHIKYSFGGGTMSRSYGRSRKFSSVLLELEKNPEFLQKTNPLYSLTPREVRSLTVMDALGISSSQKLDDPGVLGRLMDAAKADITGDDLGSLVDGTARVVGYLRFDMGDTSYTRLEKNTWESFSIPVFAHYSQTLGAIKALGLEEFLGRDSLDQVTAVGLEEYYRWNSSSILGLSTLSFDVPAGDAVKDNYFSYTQTDPAKLRRLLEDAMGYTVGSDDEGGCLGLSVITQEGVTVQLYLPLAAAPQEVREAFSWLYEKEEETVVAQSAITKNFVF